MALKCVGTIKAISEGPRPPVVTASVATRRAVAPARFFVGYFRPMFLRRIPCTAFRERGRHDIYLGFQVEKVHPRAFISGSEGLWKKASGCSVNSLSLRQKESSVCLERFWSLEHERIRCISKSCSFNIPGEIKIFQRYICGKHETSLTLKSPQKCISYDSLFDVIWIFINFFYHLYHTLYFIHYYLLYHILLKLLLLYKIWYWQNNNFDISKYLFSNISFISYFIFYTLLFIISYIF